MPSPRTLSFKKMPHWPKLAWVARMPRSSEAAEVPEAVDVFHGPCVEHREDWCAEAVWDGSFEDGDFDRTDLVVGTGVRVRGDDVFFVSSADSLNRLFWFQDAGALVVSNSLPGLMVVADTALVEGYNYARALDSIMNGLPHYERRIPTSRGDVGIVYFENIRVAGDTSVSLVGKPRLVPAFVDFASYRDYLLASAKKIGRNASEPGREHAVTPAATISSGYDSPAVALLAKEAGATLAYTFAHGQRNLRNLFDANDSGEAVARQLEMTLRTYARNKEAIRFEHANWAAVGSAGDAHLSVIDYPQPVCLLFTGFIGDLLWDRHTVGPSLLRRNDTAGVRFAEARLHLGVMLCSPVFWGYGNEPQILGLAHLPEMRPWTLGTRYDRPVPRRLLEESGVARGTFGRRKRVSSFSGRVGRPFSPGLREDFAAFVTGRGGRPGSAVRDGLAYVFAGVDYYVLQRLPEGLRFSCQGWVSMPSRTDFFLWANQRLIERYRA